MHELILWAGFAGAWLLVFGPVLQAVIELSEEDFEQSRYQDAMTSVPPPQPVSPWWWLLPPVRLYIGKRRREQWQQTMMAQLPDEDYEALTAFMAKARGWLFVAAGGLLIAVKETFELVEGHEWPIWVFWVLVVVMVLAAVGNGADQARRREPAGRRTRLSR